MGFFFAAQYTDSLRSKKSTSHDALRIVLVDFFCKDIKRPGVKFCVSDIRQKSRMALESRADSGLNPLITESHGGQNGMRVGTA